MVKRMMFTGVILAVLLAACAQTKPHCGDGVCGGPENARNCPKDCSVAMGKVEATEPDMKEDEPGGLSKSIEITVTTSTVTQGYGMTVTGVVNLDLDFPAEGGAASQSVGTVSISDYAWEEIPGCEVIIPEELIGASQSIRYENIEYYPGGNLIFTGPITYEPQSFEVALDCQVTGVVPMTEMPFSKVLGLFNEKYPSLSYKPEDGFDHVLKWGENDVFSSRVVIVTE